MPISPQNYIGLTAQSLVSHLPDFFSDVVSFQLLPYVPYPDLETRQAQEEKARVDTFLAHRPKEDTFRPVLVERKQLTSSWLTKYLAEFPSHQLLGLCSLCTCGDGSTRHIPLMDFKISPSPQAQSWILEAMQKLGQKSGFLLESGKSYHFLGLGLLTELEFVRFYGGCLLLGEGVDTRYIGHRLKDMNGVIRITSNAAKPNTPVVVRAF
jgi:hypothetical protein